MSLPLELIVRKMKLIDAETKVEICRDPDDDKFINCAIDAKCYYIVSGDKDLLDIKQYKDVQILKVADFLEMME
ncbi:MAG: putative toxin-antitoxin system toxin component, PIN family [Lachnospiraceae bacterium]|nr:putative toxin-antitoxin system toxin component, PIN family [Lachnospiraceae bacterium]